MFTRPFTVISRRWGGVTEAVTLNVPDGKKNALEHAQEQLPGRDIIAMVPGDCARNTYTFNSATSTAVPKNDGESPWPVNLPPGF